MVFFLDSSHALSLSFVVVELIVEVESGQKNIYVLSILLFAPANYNHIYKILSEITWVIVCIPKYGKLWVPIS